MKPSDIDPARVETRQSPFNKDDLKRFSEQPCFLCISTGVGGDLGHLGVGAVDPAYIPGSISWECLNPWQDLACILETD